MTCRLTGDVMATKAGRSRSKATAHRRTRLAGANRTIVDARREKIQGALSEAAREFEHRQQFKMKHMITMPQLEALIHLAQCGGAPTLRIEEWQDLYHQDVPFVDLSTGVWDLTEEGRRLIENEHFTRKG